MKIVAGPATEYENERKLFTSIYVELDDGAIWCYFINYRKNITEMFTITHGTIAGGITQLKLDCILELDLFNPRKSVDRFNKLLLLK